MIFPTKLDLQFPPEDLFFMSLFMLKRKCLTSRGYNAPKEGDHYIIHYWIPGDIKKFLRILQTPERFHNSYE